MLVLSRRVGEEIVIAGQITVKVISMKGRNVRLGIEAPEHVPVHRSEICAMLLELGVSFGDASLEPATLSHLEHQESVGT